MRGKARRREVVEAFVAWFAPGQPPPRKNAVRGFAQDLLQIAGDEPIAEGHLDALVRMYRKRFAGPRTIVEARHVGEQMRRWCEERAKGRVDITAPPPTSEPPPPPAVVEDPSAPTTNGRASGTRSSRPPHLGRDTLPDSSPPPDEVADATAAGNPGLVQVAAAARQAKVHTLPGTGGAAAELRAIAGPGPAAGPAATTTLPDGGDETPAAPAVEPTLKLAGARAAAPAPRSNTLPGLGKAIAEAKKRPSGKQRRMVGPTLPGMGIVQVLGDAEEAPGERPGIFRGTLPGMGKVVDEPNHAAAETEPIRERHRRSTPPPSQPPTRGSRPPRHGVPGQTEPGVGERSNSAAPRANEGTSGRTQPGVSRPPAAISPADPGAPGTFAPRAAPASYPPPSVPPPSGTASVPPGRPASMPPAASVPPRPSYRPIIPDPPPGPLARIANAIGWTGTPAERMRAKLVGMAIAAILLMVLIISGRSCLRTEPPDSRGAPTAPPGSLVE